MTSQPIKIKTKITPSGIALIVAVVFVLVALSGVAEKIGTHETSVTPSTHPTREVDNSATVERFRSKLMGFEYASKLFAGVEPGSASGVIKIQVTNFWFDFKPHEKRQLATMITNMWQQESGDSSVIVHIYDQTGHEVAGNSVLSGVWIETE